MNTKGRKPEDCDGDLGSYKGVDGKARAGVRGPVWTLPPDSSSHRGSSEKQHEHARTIETINRLK